MRTVKIPSETKHSDTILWEQLWYPRKQSTAIPYYDNIYDSLGNKGQRYNSRTMRTAMIPSETKHSNIILWEQLWYPRKQSTVTIIWYPRKRHSNIILWEQLWYPRKQSTAIPYYENSYDTLGNKAQQYHTMRTAMIPSETKHSNAIIMRTVMIPSETKHSNAILWEQLWYTRKQSTAIPYYENSYETLGNKAQRYHTMRSVMILSETKHSDTIIWEQLWYPRKQSTAIPYYENS